MSFENRLRDLTRFAHDPEHHPLPLGHLVERLTNYRDDSRVIVTDGQTLHSVTVDEGTSAIVCDVGKARSPMDIWTVRQLLMPLANADRSGWPVLVGEERRPLVAAVDINGILYLVVRSKRT